MSDKARSEHFLVQVDRLIDWASIASMSNPGGDPEHGALSTAVLKMLLLARWYGMSETNLLEFCQDRLSFRRFLGLPLTESAGADALGEAFRRQNAQSSVETQKLIHTIEEQLLAKGFTIRPGMLAEAMVEPVRGQPGTDRLSETAIFQLREIVELTKRDQSLLVRGGAMMVAENRTDSIDAPAPQALDEQFAPPLQAALEWPWGATTMLGERLTVGRDYSVCAFASELVKYPHVSRKHAELTACPVGVWVRDLRSRNGTFVNDERLPAGNACLVDADAQLRFGPYCIVQLKLET